MKNKTQFGFAIEYVKDIAAAKRFYVEVLGLTVEREHPTYIQFEKFAIATDESMSGSRELELYWLVPDAEAAFRELSAKAEVSMPLESKPFGKVFGVRNADGQARYVLELAAHRPSKKA